MFKTIGIAIIIVAISMNVECQINISGKVVDKFNKLPIPGVNVIEKGTKNGTVTDTSGNFRLNVSDSKAIIIFSFIGYESQEIGIKTNDSIVRLKPQCFKDWFDHQKIGFSYCGGIFKTPIGGELEFSYPAFYKQTVLKNRFSFQTNGHGINFINASAALEHLAVSCNFDADIYLNYHRLTQIGSLNLNSYSFETSLNFSHSFLRYYRIILGYSMLDLNTDLKRKYSPIFGIGLPIGKPFQIMITGKVSIFNKKPEIQGDLTRRFKKFNTFMRLYSYETFTELSAGIGFDFVYRLKKKR
jgi:hypothetical protein